MKKNLFYLFALICSMSLFTACSDDDDEDKGWMVYETPSEFAKEKLQVITNGTEQNSTDFPVTFKATSATTGTLTFKTIVNVVHDFTIEVILKKNAEGYDITGAKEMKTGYLITVNGNITNSKLYLEVTTSGYATLTGFYSAGSTGVFTLNGANVTSKVANVRVKALSETEIQLNVIQIVPGMFFMEAGANIGLAIPATMTQSVVEGKIVYSFDGTVISGASTVKITGTIKEGKMTAALTHAIDSPIVGKWKIKTLAPQMADAIFEYESATGKVVFPDSVMALIPAGLPFKKEMTDIEITTVLKQMLGTYALFLNSLEFKADGSIVASIVTVGQETAAPQEIAGLLNYVIREDGKLYLVPNFAALNPGTKAYNPSFILAGDGIPFDFQVSGSALSVSVDDYTIKPLLPVANNLFSLLGAKLPEDVKYMVNLVLSNLSEKINGVDANKDGKYEIEPCKKIKAGLNFTKK